jgi:prophage antirepressor-like protein
MPDRFNHPKASGMGLMETFTYGAQHVRTVMFDEEPWFVAADVCAILGLENVTRSLARLDEDEVRLIDRMTLLGAQGKGGRGGAQIFNAVSESGLYALIFTSIKPEAKRFSKWVTSEVLPTRRRAGRYRMPGADDDVTATDLRPAELWPGMAQVRVTSGKAAARRMWAVSPLPPIPDDAGDTAQQLTDAIAFLRVPQVTDSIVFLRDCIEVTGAASDRIPCGDLGRHYNDWRAARGWCEVTANSAGRHLKAASSIYRDPVTGRTFSHIKSGVAMFVGLRLRPD